MGNKNLLSKFKHGKLKIQSFDYRGILEPLIANSAKKKENIILLTTGSFNPIHRMHLEILNIAYKKLLSLEKYNIICAFISPSADCYVANKQGPLIPFELRCEMIQRSIGNFYRENKDKNDEMLKIYLHKWEGSHPYFIDFPDVINEIQKQLDNLFGNIILLYVCGLDHYIKCHSSLRQNVIAIDRKPFNKKFGNDILKNDLSRMIFFIKDENSEPYSSSSIREYYQKGDLESIKKTTFPDVFDLIIRFYDEHKDSFQSNYKIKQYNK